MTEIIKFMEIIGTIAFAISGALVAIGARLYSGKYKLLHKKCQEADGNTKSFMLEILQNILGKSKS